MIRFFRKKPKTAPKQPILPPPSPPMTAEQFINKFRRNYVNYGALIEVAFGLGPEMDAEYERLSDDDRKEVVRYAKAYAEKA